LAEEKLSNDFTRTFEFLRDAVTASPGNFRNFQGNLRVSGQQGNFRGQQGNFSSVTNKEM
jgi:hypothetical protein